MSKKTVKIIAIVIASIFILGIFGPLAYMFVFSEPIDTPGSENVGMTQNSIELKYKSRERFRAVCEKGISSYADAILSSESISDFTDRLVIAGELFEYDKNIMESIKSES